ncbi:MAG: hypothetical protein QXU54_00680 [Candidatus Micrarchaeia archaeon]
MTVSTKSHTQAQSASKRTSKFTKFLLTSAAIAMIAWPANGFPSDNAGSKNNPQNECQQLELKSKSAINRCKQGYQPACEEYQKLIAERVEKCVNDEGQVAPKPQLKPKKKAPAK